MADTNEVASESTVPTPPPGDEYSSDGEGPDEYYSEDSDGEMVEVIRRPKKVKKTKVKKEKN